MENRNSRELFIEAKKYIPGGVNSPVRSFKGISKQCPRFIYNAKGAYIFDEDGNKYIDYVGSWGPMILGHADLDVIEGVKEQAMSGLSYGAPCGLEVELAKQIISLMPSIEKIRFVNSGTEATMSAVRVARAYTQKNKIIKFVGCYHGHADQFLVAAGSGALSLGTPSSPGVPSEVVQDTLLAQYNDIDSVKELFSKYKDEIACIIVEPIAGNMNFITPKEGFLKSLRDLCDENNSLLIFDEVMTGFRVSLNGAQGIYDIDPDITTLGKVIGGGMPVGAFGGKKDIMNMLAPVGDVYQAGTLSGNPIAMRAGIETLSKISKKGFFDSLECKADKLVDGLNNVAKEIGIDFYAKAIGGMFGLFFSAKEITTFKDLENLNIDLFNEFFSYMIERGVYIAPSAYEAGFISNAHSDVDIDKTLSVATDFFIEYKKSLIADDNNTTSENQE